MVDPAWFLSTLSQSSAALVGLIVTLSTIQYQLERQRREKRTEDFRKKLLEFEEKFQEHIGVIAGEFVHLTDGDLFGNISHLSNGQIRRKANKADYPNTSLVWAHLARVSGILDDSINPSATPEDHYLLSDPEFDKLRTSILWLEDNFEPESEVMAGVFNEMDFSDDNPFLNEVFHPDPNESFQNWIIRHRDDGRRYQQLFSGKNLTSFRQVILELHSDFRLLDSLRANTIVTWSPNIRKILAEASLLIVVGVFLPLTVMISDIPSELYFLHIDGHLLFLYESLLLVLSLLFTLRLIFVSLKQFY